MQSLPPKVKDLNTIMLGILSMNQLTNNRICHYLKIVIKIKWRGWTGEKEQERRGGARRKRRNKESAYETVLKT